MNNLLIFLLKKTKYLTSYISAAFVMSMVHYTEPKSCLTYRKFKHITYRKH